MIASRWRQGSLAVRGATLAYLGLLVALPLGVLAFQVARTGPTAFFKTLADPIALQTLPLAENTRN